MVHYEIGKNISKNNEAPPGDYLSVYFQDRYARVELLEGVFGENPRVIVSQELGKFLGDLLEVEHLPYSHALLLTGNDELDSQIILIGEL